MIGFMLACILVTVSVPAFALPNGTESLTSSNISFGPGTTNDGFFILKAFSGPVGGPLTAVPTGASGLSCDGWGTGIWTYNPDGRNEYQFEIKAQNGLGSFVLTDVNMSKVNVASVNYSGVTVKGYQGTNLVCSTTPFESGGVAANTKFPISFAQFAGVRIDSFRISFVKEDGSPVSTFNLASFTIAEASALSPAASDARLQSGMVKGQAVSSLGTSATTPQAAVAGSVTITRAQSMDTTGTSPYATQFVAAAAGASVKVVKYTSGASFANFAADTSYAGQVVSGGDRFVVRVTSQDPSIVRYYVINVTVTAEAIAAVSVSIPAPAAGGTPAIASDVTGGANFTVTSLVWNETMTSGGKFKAGISYSATLRLTASVGYTFPAGFAGVTAAGFPTVGSYSVSGSGSGNSVTCTVTFPVTAPLKLTAIQVTGQPRLSYKDGNALDLSDMVILETYNDGSQGSVTFTGGTAANYIANPSNGSTLSNAQHDSYTVLITYTGVIPNLTVQTGTLTVAPLGTVATLSAAAVKGVAVTDLGTPGNTPETAISGLLTLSRVQGADITGTAPFVTLFTPTDSNASMKVVKYASGGSCANFGTDAAYLGQAVSNGDRFVIRVTAEDGVKVCWYAVDATVLLEEIDSVSLTVTAPATGEVPQSAANIPEGTNYTVTGLVWNEALILDNYFKAGTIYTAGLQLTAKAGYTFPEDFSAVIAPSSAGISSVTVLGTGGHNILSLTLSFDETDALTVAAIDVATQPKLVYKEGHSLDLNGMAIKRIYNDRTEDIVTFTDGTAADFSAEPVHGTVLDREVHNGHPVTVTYTGITPHLTAETGDLAVAALSSDASLSEALIKGQAASSLGTPGASPDAALTGSVTLTRAQSVDTTGMSPYISFFTPTDGFATWKAVKYASGASHANFDTDAAYAGQAVSSGDRFVIRVTAENGTVIWYQIEVTVLLEEITSAPVTIPAPTAGGTPASAGEATGVEGFSVTGLTWNEALTENGKFKADTVYTASLMLTSSNGYTFPTSFSNITVSGSVSVGSYLVTGTGTGNNACCVVTYPTTQALYVTAIEVTTQPELSYKHGNALDLSGMVVTQTYNDYTRDTVIFTGGVAASFTSEPANNTILSHTLNDCKPVTVTYTGVSPHLTTQTENLLVVPLGTVTKLSAATVKGVTVTDLGTPGASPDAAVKGSVTLTRAQGADTTGTVPYSTLFTSMDGYASVKAVKYAFGASYANFDTDAAYAGQKVSNWDCFVVRVTAEDGVTIGWYRIEAAVLLEEVTSASITITAPAAGIAPQNAADILGDEGYTVTGLAWNEVLTPGGKFKAGTAYTALLTLTANPGYTFPEDFAGVSAAGSSEVGFYRTNGTGLGNSVSCVVSFPATTALYVTGIEVTTQPKLAYKDGYMLDLSGMAVRQTYNDFTQETITFTDGTAADYIADPSNGSALIRAVYDGQPVTITYTGVTPNLTAKTENLSVAALSTDASLLGAVIKGRSTAGFAMAISPEAAVETAITLPYTAAVDTVGLAPYETAFTATDSFAAVKAVKYHYGASYANFDTDPAYAGQAVSYGDRFVVRVTAEDKVTVRYCVFAVTIQYSDLTSMYVSITAPAAGGQPQTVAETLGDVGFSVTGLVWNEPLTPGGKFKAGTAYTASLTLIADVGYTFPSGFTGVTVPGASSVDTYIVTGTGSGNSASCVAAFPKTASLATALLMVDTQPAKLVYREGDALDLIGMTIKRMYNDGTEDTVAFTDGMAAGFEVSLANGTVLSREVHNGYGVTITETASGYYAYTAELTVLPPLIPESQLQATIPSGMTVIADGSFSDGAQLMVTPIEEVDAGYEDLSSYLDEKQVLSAYEVEIVPEGFYEMPITLSFAVDNAYNGHPLYIYHSLQNGSVELFTPTVQNGAAVITITSLSPFLLAVDPVVEITAQPQDATVYVGQAASFIVAAQGVMPLAYQWQNRAGAGQDWRDIALSTHARHLTGAANLIHDRSQYRVRITDGLGRIVYSDAATLTVKRLNQPPATGDDSHPVLYAFITVFMAASAALLLKKRRRA